MKEQDGARFADLTLSINVHAFTSTRDRRAAAEKSAKAYGMTPEDVLESPHFFIGEEAAVRDQILALREDFGIAWLQLSGTMIDAAAPLISKLAGA